MDARQLNGAALAYIGDAVYELAVRRHLIQAGLTGANDLHRAAVKYVGAVGQAQVMRYWLSQENFLNPEEIRYYKRGRNHKANTKAKHASIADYRQATGFESLLGYLFLTQQASRLEALMAQALAYIDQEDGHDECK